MPNEGKKSVGRNWLSLGLLAVLLGSSLFVFYGNGFENFYSGYAALLAIPAALGGLISQFSDPDGSQSPVGCFLVPTLAILGLVALAWLFFGEGAICIVMVLPFWVSAAITGALVNRWNARRRKLDSSANRFLNAGWLALPLILLFWEQGHPPIWQEVSVTREVRIMATAQKVWPLLIEISKISLSEGKTNFTQDVLGVPRPSEAVLQGTQPTLVRKARWGKDLRFDEVITELKPQREIVWNFSFPDNSVQRYTDRHISPDGPMLKIASGRYAIEGVSPGVTRVRLTTKYCMRSQLAFYFRVWGEILLGDIQSNVLTIVKDRAEGTT